MEINDVITPRQVIEAYRTSGIVPVYGDWGYVATVAGKNVKCGCALTALAACKSSFDEVLSGLGSSDEVFEYLSKLLGYRIGYLEGFVAGFDNHHITISDHSDEYTTGYNHGKETRILVDEALG
jgi:hypothetical protein